MPGQNYGCLGINQYLGELEGAHKKTNASQQSNTTSLYHHNPIMYKVHTAELMSGFSVIVDKVDYQHFDLIYPK